MVSLTTWPLTPEVSQRSNICISELIKIFEWCLKQMQGTSLVFHIMVSLTTWPLTPDVSQGSNIWNWYIWIPSTHILHMNMLHITIVQLKCMVIHDLEKLGQGHIICFYQISGTIQDTVFKFEYVVHVNKSNWLHGDIWPWDNGSRSPNCFFHISGTIQPTVFKFEYVVHVNKSNRLHVDIWPWGNGSRSWHLFLSYLWNSSSYSIHIWTRIWNIIALLNNRRFFLLYRFRL